MLILGQFEAIDLTHTINSSIPTWTGGCGFSHEVKMDYDQGVRVLSYKCHSGIGTHMDAPAHFYRDGATIADIPLDQIIIPACVLDLSSKMDPDMLVMSEDILESEKRWGRVEKGSLFLVYTGWEKYWNHTDRYRNVDQAGKMHFPGYHATAAELLLERGVVGIGIDTLSPDGSNNKNKFPVHELMLGAGKYIIENAAQLSRMPARGAFALALPMKVSVGAEAPIRLVGLIPKR